MDLLPGRYPAIVRSYDPSARQCRVEIPGITDGGDVFPLAEIEYPIGDKSRRGLHTTEIEILPGDTVWVAFIGGDPRYPIITGYRNPNINNSLDWRRWHHKNIEHIGDELINNLSGHDNRIKSGNDLQFQCETDALTRCNNDLRAQVNNRAQIVSNGRLLLRSVNDRVVIMSSRGTFVL
jgi:hypothetical protein